MNYLISGSSGLIGTALLDRLVGEQVHTVRLKTGSSSEHVVGWKAEAGELDREALHKNGPYEAVVHLAGENVAAGRWSASRRAAIMNSRAKGTLALCQALAKLEQKPRVLICASAIGYYGDRGTEMLDEHAPKGNGFLAEVCQAWEDGTRPAREVGIRTIHLRIGLVLATQGGALKAMLLPFKLGLGGRLGSGEQYVSWITLPDLLAAIAFCIEHESIAGPINAVAPNPVTNREFTKILGAVLKRPAIFPVPEFALKLLLGRQMAEEMLLCSARVLPHKLLSSGFTFAHEQLQPALRAVLAK